MILFNFSLVDLDRYRVHWSVIISSGFEEMNSQWWLIISFCFSGIPIWVGRKLHARYSAGSRHRRNLAVVGGVTASVS